MSPAAATGPQWRRVPAGGHVGWQGPLAGGGLLPDVSGRRRRGGSDWLVPGEGLPSGVWGVHGRGAARASCTGESVVSRMMASALGVCGYCQGHCQVLYAACYPVLQLFAALSAGFAACLFQLDETATTRVCAHSNNTRLHTHDHLRVREQTPRLLRKMILTKTSTKSI